MKIKIKIDSTYNDPEIIIFTDEITDDIDRLVKILTDENSQIISGIRYDRVEVLDPDEIIRVYANSKKVYAVTDKGEYTLRFRLYEAEERLGSKNFVRISKSEIINLKKVNSFDMNLAGTICVRLSNNEVTYVSRRYVAEIKKVLGVR
ncbi:MAG: LytTR family transcriptional regulator [Eubacterium sp.]|nr:LytTR family transcriptional regulator [Eubacterium sp.]